MNRLKHFADEGGRDMKTLSVSVFGAAADTDYIEQCHAAGVDRVIFALPSKDKDTLLPLISRFTKFIQ